MVSIVIPFFNEVESLAILHGEIARVIEPASGGFEIIFVDDGSTDGSWEVITKLTGAATSEPRASASGQPQPPRVHGIRFRRNFGKAAALSAGFAAARGDIIMTLDADLQDDPAEIPNFLLALDLGMDVISGWKKTRHDPWHKVWPSRVFNGMVSWLTGVTLHDHNCGMKCYRAAIFREIRLYGELHRFIPVLAAARGFKVGEVVIKHRPRKFGHSKYGVRRFVKGFLDLSDRQVPDGLRPATATYARQHRPVELRAGHARIALSRRDLAHTPLEPRSFRAVASTAADDLCRRRAAARRPDDVDRLPRGTDHRLPEPRPG